MEKEIAITRIRTILGNLSSTIREYVADYGSSDNQANQDASMSLIEMLDHLVRLVETQMRTSPADERERTSNLTEALENGPKAQSELQILNDLLERQRKKHQADVMELKRQIEDERIALDAIKVSHNQDTAEKKSKLELEMKKIIDETVIEKSKIEKEIELKNSEHQTAFNANLEREKKLYSIRKKAEHEYLKILEKYDEDVGELHRTMEASIEESNLLERKLRCIEEKLSIQDAEYIELKEERETAIMKAFTENLTNFMRNRAAKVIQKAWREHFQRMQQRKKKKSKKKK